MTATPTATEPRNIAAEFVALMVEQADLTRRCFDVLATAFREQSADHAKLRAAIETFEREADNRRRVLDSAPRPTRTITATVEVRGKPETEPPAPAPNPEPKHDPAPAAPAKSRRDLVLDLYGSTTLTTTEMAEHLSLGQSTVQGTIVGTRRSGDLRIVKGDAARLALRRAANPEPAPKPSTPSTSPLQQDPAATARTAVPHLAPAPRAPQKREPKPVTAAEPLPAPRTPAEHKARAEARARVLRHYGETGDYEGQIAQKLGYLRAWVVAFIDEARREKDPRVTVGDGRRRLRERAA